MTEPEWVSLDHDIIPPRDRYRYLSGAIVPRPIALVTTVSSTGRRNAAPFSFFNCLSVDLGILALGLESNKDESLKHTSENIRRTGEFTVNLVSAAMFDAMRVCASPVGVEIDEVELAGLTPIPCDLVAPPRLQESPVAFECERHVTIEISASRQIVLGYVRRLHFRADVIDLNRKRINQDRLDLIGRMAGSSYVRLKDIFDAPPIPVSMPGGPTRKTGGSLD